MLKILTTLSLFFIFPLYAADYQYIIPSKYYLKSHTISLGGGQNILWAPGEIFDNAAVNFNQNNKNLSKCNSDQKSKVLLIFKPESFYNPQTTIFQTDLKIDRVTNKGDLIKMSDIRHKTVSRMHVHEKVILTHYEELLSKLKDAINSSTEVQNQTVDGDFCSKFSN